MTLLRDLTRLNWETARDGNPWHDDFDGLPEPQKQELDEDTRKLLQYLAESHLPPIAMMKVGMALGELRKTDPDARLGDMFAAQWKAALIAIAEEKADEPETPL